MPGQARRGFWRHAHRVLTPGQGALPQRLDGGGQRVGLGAFTEQRGQLGQRDTATIGAQHEQRIQHGQGQEVEPVGRGLHRLTGLGPGGQCRDGPRGWLGQIGAQLQQPDELIVGQLGQPRAQRHDGS